MGRPIVKTIPVMPGLAVLVEDSHTILIEIWHGTGTGLERNRSNAITNVEALRVALDAARVWVQMEES